MKKGIENTLWNMKECGCQEDIIREYEKLIESPHREEAVAMLEMYCKQLQEQIEKEYKAVAVSYTHLTLPTILLV